MSHRDCKPAARERSQRFADSGARRPKLRPGGLILHHFANGRLRCVHCAARVTNPLGIAADHRIGMPVGLDLASRSFLQWIALNFFWYSPLVMCVVIPWVLRKMWEQGCGWHTSVPQPHTWQEYQREGVLELSLEALFNIILLESKDLFIYFCFWERKKKIEDWEKNTGYLLAVLVYAQKLDLGNLFLMLQLAWCCGSLHHQSLN